MFDVDLAELVAKLAPKLRSVKKYIVLTDSANTYWVVSCFSAILLSPKLARTMVVVPMQTGTY